MGERDKLRPDVNEIAFRTVQAATGQGEKPKQPKQKRAIKPRRGRNGARRKATRP